MGIHKSPLHQHTNYRHFCQQSENNEKNNPKQSDKSDEKKEEKSFFSVIEEGWNKAKDEMQRQQEQQQKEQQQNEESQTNNSDNRNEEEHKQWIDKYDAIKAANKFEVDIVKDLDFKNQWDLLSTMYIKDPLFRFAMNSWITGFADRFLYYEEFMVGVMEGLNFVIDSLQNDDFESVKDCMVKEIYSNIKPFKDALLSEGYCLNKLNGAIYNVRVDRERIDMNQIMEQQKAGKVSVGAYNTPVEMFFDLKYYAEFRDEKSGHCEYKVIDVLWNAKYEPIEGARLKYEISKAWNIQHITVSVISRGD